MAHIHHHDKTNVGDWWCQPYRYFPLKPGKVYSITKYDPDLSSNEIHVVGGGGLGTEYFRPHLDRLGNAKRRYKLIAWGVGIDQTYSEGTGLKPDGPHHLYGDYFDGFDDVGTRVFGEHPTFRWVPCASCMHPAFFKYRDRKPTRLIGMYQHKRNPIKFGSNPQLPVSDNSGTDIIEKLDFLSQHHFVVTNTYHGVYWATLLGRKVICLPFKSGLFSFRHKPVYSTGSVDDALVKRAVSYGTSLEECRLANIEYYRYLTQKYGDF